MTLIAAIVAIIFSLLPSLGQSNSVHGGTYLAMAGKDSVVLVADSRFATLKSGAFNLGEAPRCVFRVGSRTLVGCFGLSSDSKILMDKLRSMLIDHYETENHSDLDSNNIAHVVSNILYESNLLLSPIVVGLDRDGKPSIVVMDELGAQTSTDQFAVTGTAAPALYGLCESQYNPDFTAEELVQTAGLKLIAIQQLLTVYILVSKSPQKCFRAALQRDVMSGGSVRVYTLTKDSIYLKEVSANDI